MSSANPAESYDEPIYYLKFSTSGANIEVRLNDIPVLRDDSPGSATSEIPVPESIIDGENILTVSITPLENEDSLFIGKKWADTSLIVREKNAPLSEYDTLIHLKIDAVIDEDRVLSGSAHKHGNASAKLIEHNEQRIVARRSIDIKSPFPRWSWQDGVEIEKNQRNYDELFQEYKKIYAILSNKNMENIRKLYSHAAKEFAAAYHYDDIEDGHRIINTGSFANDDSWELGDIQVLIDKGIKFNLDIYANGKLARLVDDYGDEMVIVYFNPEAELISYQKFGFYKNQDGEWVMIR